MRYPTAASKGAIMFLLSLAGCTVGPSYSGPPQATPRAAAGGRFVRSSGIALATQAPVAEWWTSLNDPTLDALIRKALTNNPDGQAAAARLRQARAQLRLERANSVPSINGSAIYARARIPGANLGGTGSSSEEGDGTSGNGSSDLNIYNLGFDASWEIDVFGGRRRTVEASRASAEAVAANLADTQVSLTAEVANAYINLRDRQQRIILNTRSVAMQEQAIVLTRQRAAQGTASRLDVTRLQQELETVRADIQPLSAERDAYLDQLATLVGEEPGAVDVLLGSSAPIPLPPETVMIGDPAALLQRRPDIRAAERTLAADTARIGVAEAARFPQVSFMGILGLGGTRLSDIDNIDNPALIALPRLSWSFLDFGRNRARVAQAEAVREEAEARYRSAVLNALRDAEGALSRFGNARRTLATLIRARAAATLASQLSQQRFRAGTTSLIDVLDVQRQEIAANQSVSQAQALLSTSFVGVQKSLGLGWDTASGT